MNNSPRYIDADEFEKQLEKIRNIYLSSNSIILQDNGRFLDEVIINLNKQSVTNVQEVKHGKWIQKNNGTKNIYYCSECDRHIECRFPNPEIIFPYCHCGAKMDGE